MTERIIAYRCFVDWDHDGDFGEAFEDISAYLVSARGEMRFSPPESSITAGRGIVANMSLTLRNADGRFSPLRTDGPLYVYLANGGMYHAPCYLEVSIDGGANYDRVFTGVLKLPNLNTLTTRQAPTLTIDARSMEERLLQWRTSTPQVDFAAYHDGGYTEADLIEAWLDNAGVAAGDMTLDGGLIAVPWAWLDDESPVEEIWALAGACGGRYYCDPDGIHRYENMAHWQIRTRSTAVQRRYTKDDYRLLAAAYDDRDLYNTVTVEVAPRTLATLQVVWESDDAIKVSAGATETVTARFDAAVYVVDSITFKARTVGGTNITADISISPTYQAQRATLAITNAADVAAYIYPLQVLGRTLEGKPTREQTVESDTDGDNNAFFSDRGINRTRSLRGNFYIQEDAHAATLAQYILHRHEYPRVTWRLTDCPGHPDLRLGDRIEIADNDWQEKDGQAGPGVSLGSGSTRIISSNESVSSLTIDDAVVINSGVTVTVTAGSEWLLRPAGIYALLLAIGWQLDSNGFRQNLEAIAVNNLFRHDGQYFVLNQAGHTLNGTKKVFY
jgi:hypothetical protein